MSNVIAKGISSTLKDNEKEAVRENIGAASQADIAEILKHTKMIGEAFPLMLDTVPPDNSGTAKFIKLSANLTGSGQYNQGLLSSQSASGSGPTLQYTAEISLAGSPLNGQRIHLINSEGSHLRPRTSTGIFEQDQMQLITGTITSTANNNAGPFGSATGVMSVSNINGSFRMQSDSGSGYTRVNFNSSGSGARTGDETKAKSVSAVYYMRIL